MAKSFQKLRDRLSGEARDRVDQRVRDRLLEMSVQELRQKISGKTQVRMEELLRVTRGAISQLEGRQDILLSKLARYSHALGGGEESRGARLWRRIPDMQGKSRESR